MSNKNIPTAQVLLLMFRKINEDCIMHGEGYVSISFENKDYYVEQTDLIFDIGLTNAEPIVNEMIKLNHE